MLARSKPGKFRKSTKSVFHLKLEAEHECLVEKEDIIKIVYGEMRSLLKLLQNILKRNPILCWTWYT